MSSSDDENETLTPESFRTNAAVIVDDLLPPKSRDLYLKTYNLFCDWKTTNGANSFSECVFLNYFNELTKTKKASTLWSIYSMLKSTVRIKHNIDISNYSKLVTYLKRLSEGDKPKKSRVLTSQNIERFLNDAPDHSFLAVKRVLILLGVVAVSLSAPQGPADKVVAILSQEFDQQPDGSYRYSYEAENGIKAEEAGTLKKAAGPDASDVIVAQGGFSYTAPDGTVINLNYIADDENGFKPEGAHLPTPPPIPPEIQKALDYLATLPPPPAGRN